MTLRSALVVLLAALAAAPVALAQQPAAAPSSGAQPSEKSAAKPKIYDESADAKTQIAAAVAKAKKNNTRVLVQWGGNWCGWCIRLHELSKSNKDIARTLMNEYEVVLVDAGQPKGKNVDLAMSYGADLQKYGFPFLAVLDSAGKPIANQETEALEVKADGKSAGLQAGHDPVAVLKFLSANKAAPMKAQEQYDAALADAKKSSKRVFLHFGAPWCGWCHRLEDWMARPEIATLLAKDFVDLKIDTDRAVGGAEMLKKVRGSESGGIPWIAFLDDSGKAIVTSDGPKGNTGFPSAPEEIAHFEAMLKKAAKNLTAADIEKIAVSLRAKEKPAGN